MDAFAAGLLTPALTRMRRRVVNADVDAVALTQQLAQVGMVGSSVSGASQVNHIGHHRVWCCVGRLAAPVTMGQCGGASLPVSRQDAPGVAWADTHQGGCLAQRHVLSEQTVQNLKSRLFFLSQCHIHLMENVTFLLAN